MIHPCPHDTPGCLGDHQPLTERCHVPLTETPKRKPGRPNVEHKAKNRTMRFTDEQWDRLLALAKHAGCGRAALIIATLDLG